MDFDILVSLRQSTRHHLIESGAFATSAGSPKDLAMMSASAISSLPIRSTTKATLPRSRPPVQVLHRVTSSATKSPGDHFEAPKAGVQGAPPPDDAHKATSNAPAEVVQPQGASGEVSKAWTADSNVQP